MYPLLISLVACSLSLITNANASDASTFTQVYFELKTSYIEKIDIEPFAIDTLKKLREIDPKIQLADDSTRLSLYYNVQVVRSWLKPEDKNDAKAWGQLSGDILKEAERRSPKIDKQSFRLIDDLLKNSVAELGHNSKYFPSLELDDSKAKSKIYFAIRLMDDILYLKIADFNQYTKDKVKDAIKENPDYKALIIDVRGNNGGNLVAMVDTVDLFLDKGVIISTRDRDQNITYYNAKPDEITGGKPMVVMVDGDTASAAEAFAASLQEQGRAKIVGTSTFGKGTVQSLVNLDNDSVLALTTAEVFTPGDKKIDGVGVAPDLCVTENCLPEKRADKEADITTALKLLRGN